MQIPFVANIVIIITHFLSLFNPLLLKSYNVLPDEVVVTYKVKKEVPHLTQHLLSYLQLCGCLFCFLHLCNSLFSHWDTAVLVIAEFYNHIFFSHCLLYTSDAADEL